MNRLKQICQRGTMSTTYDPLTPEEVNDAAKEFFPLFDIVHRNMPENCTVEDTIKVMETVCSMAQKRRAYDKGEVGPFGFNKKPDEVPATDTATNIFEYGI